MYTYENELQSKFVLIYDTSTEEEIWKWVRVPKLLHMYIYIVVDKWGLALKDLETLSSVFFYPDVAHDAAQI